MKSPGSENGSFTSLGRTSRVTRSSHDKRTPGDPSRRKGAIKAFKFAEVRDPDNADIKNFIGYAYRRLRQLEPAFAYYRAALVSNPRHRSAHEHLGEAYLVQEELDKAEEQLEVLGEICLIPCVEYQDLQAAIAGYNRSAARTHREGR